MIEILKLKDTEKLDLTNQEKKITQTLLGHLYYCLENGFTENQIKNALKKILDEMQK